MWQNDKLTGPTRATNVRGERQEPYNATEALKARAVRMGVMLELKLPTNTMDCRKSKAILCENIKNYEKYLVVFKTATIQPRETWNEQIVVQNCKTLRLEGILATRR